MTQEDSPQLTSSDEAVVQSEVDRMKSEPPRRDPTGPGCLIAFVGMLTLTLTPALGNWVEIPLPTGRLIFIAAVLAIFAGAFVAMFGARLSGTRSASKEVQHAVGPILAYVQSKGDRETALRAATRLLSNAYESPGPYTVSVFDAQVMAQRLGPKGVDFVRAVEQYMLDVAAGIYPVFTNLPEDETS